jgi:hypothetical protein
VQGAVLALVVRETNTNLSTPISASESSTSFQARAKPELITPQAFSALGRLLEDDEARVTLNPET